MKLRNEQVTVTIRCDINDCDEQQEYTSDEAPYEHGWRTAIVRVLDKYDDRTEVEVTRHICVACRIRLFGEDWK